MSLKEAAAREAFLKTLLDVVDGAYKAARAETQLHLDKASEETGTRQVAVSLPDGPDIATVSLSAGEGAAKVTDPEKFKAWVLENYSSEIKREFVTSVQPAFEKKILAELTAANSTEWADMNSGVVHDIPGVQIVAARARTHNVRFKKEGRDQVIKAWREGRLADVALPALTAGGAE
ncbi:hypothetical protein ACFYNA_15570 [Streptomyces sp. NPDC006640]|uniref:hypothetical protein n=1 Tax=Streptomyces sp. NPDC006640 TaxID=3364754 RepID=UPI00368292C2